MKIYNILIKERNEITEKNGKTKKKKKKRKDSNVKVSVVSCELSHLVNTVHLPSVENRFTLSLIGNDIFEDLDTFFSYIVDHLQQPFSGPYFSNLSGQLYWMKVSMDEHLFCVCL